jgi:hypothetical protein
MIANGVAITDALQYVQGKLDHLNNQEKKLLQDIKEDNTGNEDIDLEKTNNDIF